MEKQKSCFSKSRLKFQCIPLTLICAHSWTNCCGQGNIMLKLSHGGSHSLPWSEGRICFTRISESEDGVEGALECPILFHNSQSLYILFPLPGKWSFIILSNYWVTICPLKPCSVIISILKSILLNRADYILFYILLYFKHRSTIECINQYYNCLCQGHLSPYSVNYFSAGTVLNIFLSQHWAWA